MLKRILSSMLFIAVLSSVSIAQDNNVKKFAGVWKGLLDMQGQTMTVIFSLTEKDGKLSGTAESPEQGGGAVPLENIVVTANKIQLEIPMVRAGYEGTLKPDNKNIDGTLVIQEQGIPLPLVKDEKAAQAEDKKIDSYWEGSLTTPNGQIPLVFKTYTKKDGTIGGLLDSPLQKVSNIPASSAVLTADELKFEISAMSASYSAKIDKATMTAKGTFTQGGQEFALDLKKVDKPTEK
jgi:hypothetical protein